MVTAVPAGHFGDKYRRDFVFKIAFVVGLISIVLSFFGFLYVKPLDGSPFSSITFLSFFSLSLFFSLSFSFCFFFSQINNPLFLDPCDGYSSGDMIDVTREVPSEDIDEFSTGVSI